MQSVSLFAVDISVAIDRKDISVDESFTLTFTAKEAPNGEPDFSSLTKDFEILNQSKRSSVNIINGKMQQSLSWDITLYAKQAGQLIVPSINFGNDKTKESALTIKASGQDPSAPETIFLETFVDTDAPYVQAQVKLTVQLYFSETPVNASLSEPEFDTGNVILEKLGDDKSYRKAVNGKTYEVVERIYVLFPQESGELLIPSLLFRGDIGVPRQGFFSDPFMRQHGKTVVKRSKPITLSVKPIPQAFTGKDWLPAKSIRIEEHWSNDPNRINAGEPVTRTLKLIAEGLPASQLPLLDVESNNQIKQYPDQPTFSENYIQSGIKGMREDKIAMIINSVGDYRLAEIKIPWWNTETETMEIFELPARTITVNGVASTKTSSISPLEKENKELLNNTETESNTTDNSTPLAKEGENIFAWKLATAIFGFLWILTLMLVFKRSNKVFNKDRTNKLKTKEISKNNHLKQFRLACKNNNAEMARDELLSWAKLEYIEENIISISDVARFGDEIFKEEIMLLNSALYSNAKTNWRGENLLNAFSQIKPKNMEKTKQKEILKPLHNI